ncbi:MAG TPA: hypothetical protein VGN81_31660 [Pseudonocardiaceae bacterium]|jgi:hypothetical protein
MARFPFARLFIRPLGLFLRNPSVLILAVVLLAFNLFVPEQGIAVQIFQRGWLFDQAPRIVWPVLSSPLFVVATLLVFAGKSVVSVAASGQLMLVFRDRRTTLRATLRSIRVDGIVWLFVTEVSCYVVYALAAAVGYLPALLIWHTTGVDLTIPLVAIGLLAFPVCYSAVSTAIVVAPLPASSRERTAVLAQLRKPRVLWPLYSFCAISIVVEFLLLGVAPLALLDFLHSKLLASTAIGVGVLVPFLVLRGGSYAFIMYTLRSAPVVDAVIGRYLADTGADAETAAETDAAATG